jgi:two-component system NtrC family sensor kinase
MLAAAGDRSRSFGIDGMNRPFRIFVVQAETQAFKLRLLLEEQGWQVSIAVTAEEAQAALGDPLPDLILVDDTLPGMRGDEFCRRIRMNLNARATPLLMMTSSAPEVGLESCADDCISKSESPEILLSRIRALLRKALPTDAILNPQDSAFRNTHILAIDDNPAYLASLCDELRVPHYEVECANSGAEGLARLETQNFDCVLVDLMMPEMDGEEVCRRIASMRSTLDTPAIIILTASAKKGDLNRGLEAGADDFVSKSDDLAVLRARIQALMRRRFCQEENGRIVAELKARQLETLQARAGRQMAEARAAMAEELVQANQHLEEANRELKKTQAQLIQNERMSSLGQLVTGIAHEINNPLAFVVNNLFIVESGLENLGPEMEANLSESSLGKLRKARARLSEMREGLDRVKELVRNLRTFSRLDEGELSTVDVGETIDAVLLLLRHRMNGFIHLEKHYGQARTLVCYAGRLHQVLMNLIGNAIDAVVSKSAGKDTAEGTISITTSQSEESFVISVRDTGAGIPEAIRSRIFDPFFTTKPVGQGTGLGLSISYGIVRDHGGTIEVQSQEGAGTEFIVRIPLNLELRRKP